MEFTAVSTDTRKIAPGSLFVALKGASFDAHDFLAQAFESGAAAAVVSHLPDTAPPSGRRSAASSIPATRIRIPPTISPARSGSSLGSSATTATPPGRRWRTMAISSSSTPSTEPSPSRCSSPMEVITTWSGSTMAPRMSISPGSLVPVSTTSTSASSGAARRVRGTPIWLFRFPSVACTR